MKITDAAFEKLFPSAEELWARGGARMEEREIDPGHQEMVPFFDLEIDDVYQSGETTFGTRRQRKVGHTLLYAVRLSDGIDREVHLHLPDDPRGSDFVVTDGAAWTTKNDGYAAHRARKIVETVGVPVIQVGAEHSSRKHGYTDDLRRLGKTARNALTISLAKTAQSEELIINHLMDEFDLPRDQYVIGDSRGAMKAPGQYVYAWEYGSDVAYLDTKAPCVPDRLTAGDVDKFVRWLGLEGLGGLAVALGMARSGELHTLWKTTSLNPNFVVSSLIGVMPALAAGSDMTRVIPEDANGQIVIYDRDGMSFGQTWDERFSQHPNLYIKHVPKGVHASLLQPHAHRQQIERIGRFDELHGYYGGALDQLSAEERAYIYHGMTPQAVEAAA